MQHLDTKVSGFFWIDKNTFLAVYFTDQQVKEETLMEALTTRKTVTVGERLIVPYKLSEVRLQLHTEQ